MALKGYKDIPLGGKIVQAGNSAEYETGSWRSMIPFVDTDKCINCLKCWIMCPDVSVYVEDEKMAGFDFMHCKGCGICAHMCPVDAIEMVLESEKDSIKADERGRKQKEDQK